MIDVGLKYVVALSLLLLALKRNNVLNLLIAVADTSRTSLEQLTKLRKAIPLC